MAEFALKILLVQQYQHRLFDLRITTITRIETIPSLKLYVNVKVKPLVIFTEYRIRDMTQKIGGAKFTIYPIEEVQGKYDLNRVW